MILQAWPGKASDQEMTRRKTRSRRKPRRRARIHPLRWLLRWGLRLSLVVALVAVCVVAAHRVLNPPRTLYMRQEASRLGRIEQDWVPLSEVAPVMAAAAVAAEDANFCTHWGFDMAAIRSAIAEGAGRGASTISQQVVKNVYLWPARSWLRKAIEALITPLVEALWPKRRILEVYLNVAEFDEGVFGIEAAAQHYFKVLARDLTAIQAARLAMVLPAPKRRSASRPDAVQRARAAAILDGAATIRRDGRAACFED